MTGPVISPVIRTERAFLRPFGEDDPADVAFVLDVLGRPEVAAWMSERFDQPEVLTSTAAAREKIAGWQRHFDEPPRGYWAIVPLDGPEDESGTPVGAVCLLTCPHAEHGEVELGWWLHPDAAGHGWVTEAAAALVERAWAGGIEELWAVMYPDNTPSAAVARRLGMTELGVQEVPWYPPPTLLWRIRRPGQIADEQAGDQGSDNQRADHRAGVRHGCATPGGVAT